MHQNHQHRNNIDLISYKNNRFILNPSASESFLNFYNNADCYLHYANDILFFICKAASIQNLLKICRKANIKVAGLMNDALKKERKTRYFIENVLQRQIYDGVIDRYCGVPP